MYPGGFKMKLRFCFKGEFEKFLNDEIGDKQGTKLRKENPIEFEKQRMLHNIKVALWGDEN
jgi:hypothetical protein